jgi:hypothetical protein
MKVILFLSILDGTRPGWIGSGELWAKTVDTGRAPAAGDEVALWNTDEGPDVLWGVRRDYMDAEGAWYAELTRVVIDPNDEARDFISRDLDGYRPWHRESDDDSGVRLHLESRLRDSGWRPYRSLTT